MIKHIIKEQLETKIWSGGTTTELYIFPKSGDYKSLDFDYRISTASIDVEESNFSSLPGINRLIMSLTGPLELTHEGQDTVVLEPFDVATFKGEWLTTSKGQVVDFNLMFKESYNASMSLVAVTTDLKIQNEHTSVLYAFDSKVTIKVSGQVYDLKKGDLLVVDEHCILTIEAKNTKIIICKLTEK